ncbi:MAG: xylulokinase [Limnochordaceae bacterium]|nr:xylulokinase [Limnochordaceae bacterium]
MSAGPFILTIDVGTTACKAVMFDATGRPVGQGEQEYPTYHPRPLWAEQDPEDWWQACIAAVRRALAHMERAGAYRGEVPPDVAAIGLSSQRETVALVDFDGRPLARAISWMDRRGAAQVQALARRLGAQRIHRHTGMVPDATFTLAKLLWMREHEPELLRRAAYLLQPRDLVVHRLTGRFVTDPSLASRTMMWDSLAGRWWEAAFDEAGIDPGRFPPVVASHERAGSLTPQAAQALGLRAGVPVVTGGGDRCLEALGVALGPGEAMESTGTTSNVSTVVPEAVGRGARVPGLLYTVHVLPGHWLVEQGLNATGAILRWLRELAFGEERRRLEREGKDVYDAMSEEAGEVPPGADGLFLLPYFMGARAPRWQPQARGAAIGLTLEHTRAHLVRAAMESVALELRACRQVLGERRHWP